MMILDATDETLELLTSSTADIDVVVSYADITTTTFVGGQQETAITTATTTAILAAPGASTQRQVKGISIRNAHASSTNTVTVKFDKAATEKRVTAAITLAAGEAMHMAADGTWQVIGTDGKIKVTAAVSIAAASTPTTRLHFFYKTATSNEGAGRWYSFSKDGGMPGAWAPGSPGLNGRNTDGTTSTDAGCVPYTNATTNNYLADYDLTASQTGYFFLADVVWVNSGLVVTTTTAQAITTAAFPARDVNGSANGIGYAAGLLVTATMGNGAVSNTTLDYTNSAGTAGRTATIDATTTTLLVGSVIPFLLQAGDTGIQSIQGITLGTTYVSGTFSLIVYRVVASAAVATVNVGSPLLLSTATRLYNGTCLLHMYIATGTAGPSIAGTVRIEDR